MSPFPFRRYCILLILLRCRSEFTYDKNDEAGLSKELTLQVRKVIGPFAAPKQISIVSDLPKTRSGKVGVPLVHWYDRLLIVSFLRLCVVSCVRSLQAKGISLATSALSPSPVLWRSSRRRSQRTSDTIVVFHKMLFQYACCTSIDYVEWTVVDQSSSL